MNNMKTMKNKSVPRIAAQANKNKSIKENVVLQRPLLILDKENKNGRIYSSECVNSILESAEELQKEGTLLVSVEPPDEMDYRAMKLNHVGGRAEIEHIDNILVAKVSCFQEVPSGKILQDLLESGEYHLNPSFIVDEEGTETKDGVMIINKAILTGVYITKNSSQF